MRLTSVRVDRYGPLAGIEHEFDGGLEVCYGPNESGKTLLLDAMLRLCSPDAVDVVPDVGRVAEQPVGHAVLETGGGDGSAAPGAPADATDGGTARQVLGDGTALGDVTDLTPRQLRNVFVVRDADLRLDDAHEFYDATARRLADLHTAELDSLRDRVVDAGRLTPTTLKLSRAEEHGDAREVRGDAADLAERIREYVLECRDDGIESAERERVEVAAALERARDELARQDAAETLATVERLAEHLDTVRAATASLADRDCTPEGLDRLDAIETDLDALADDLAECERRLDDLREERESLDGELAEVEAALGPIEDRLDAVEAVETRLEDYRDSAGGIAADGDAGIGLGGAIAVAAAIGAGAAAVAGVVTVALGLTAIAGVGTIVALYRRHRSRAAADARRDVLAAARDAGLDVDSIEAVAPAVRDLRDERARLADRTTSIEQDLDLVERRIDTVETERETAIERRRERRQERRELLREAGVPDVDAYRDAVEAAEDRVDDRRQAAASLAERLGDRPDAAWAERIDRWETELDRLRADVGDVDVDADAFDPDERDRLEREVEQLEARLADLDDRLDAHETAMDRFATELRKLPTGRFREEPIALDARSVDGLAAAAAALESLVESIDRDADASRVALAALDAVHAEEEAKLASLFGEGSAASETFRSITDGRYERVTYDPDAETLRVVAAEGGTLTPRELSRGATDQLYLAARIGLANRLLPNEPGFLLLDDPLLPADPERLSAGFDALRSLAEDGWQIVYWTAKPEVGEDLVERHGLPCRRFDRLGGT